MNTRATFVLLLIAAVFGAGVWFFELRGAEEAAAKEAAAKRLLGVEAEAIAEIEVPLSGGGRAHLVREAEAAGDEDAAVWRLTEPLDFPADAAAAARLADALAGLESESTLADPPADLTPFGLGDDRTVVAAGDAEGERFEVWFGAKTPIGSARYAALASEPGVVHTVADWRATSLQPELSSLRDKRLLAIEPDAARELRVDADGKLVARLERSDAGEDGSWSIVEPIEAPADDARVERMLQDLKFARATDFVDEPGPDASYGLDLPQVAVTVASESARERIALGLHEGAAFARIEGRPIRYRVETRLVGNVPEDLFAYRFKRVFGFEQDRARRVEISFPREGEDFAFARDDWKWTSERDGVEVESLRVEDVVYALRELDATGIEPADADPAPLGLSQPLVRVRFLDEDGEELGWVEFGDPEPGVGLPARSSQSDRIWRAKLDLGEDVPLGLDAFWNNFAKRAEEDAES